MIRAHSSLGEGQKIIMHKHSFQFLLLPSKNLQLQYNQIIMNYIHTLSWNNMVVSSYSFVYIELKNEMKLNSTKYELNLFLGLQIW